MKKIILFLALMFDIFAISDIKPSYAIEASGFVTDFVYEQNDNSPKLYAATDQGKVEIFDIESKKLINSIKVPDIKDFMGDIIPAKIYSVDKLDKQILMVSQGLKGYRNVSLYDGEKTSKIIGIDKKLFIKKARFVDKDKIILGMLSNEIILYDLKQKRDIYRIQVSQSHFSDFSISEDKSYIIVSDESGILSKIDVKSGKIIKTYEGQNLDNVYQVVTKKETIITAGQDRKAGVYTDNSGYHISCDFLVYSVGLSPKATRGGIAHNEQNDVLIFDINSQSKLFNLVGQKATLSKIYFVDDDYVITSSESKSINFYKLK
jgi:hypothetical protein